MDFKDAVSWLYSFQKFGIKPGLKRITYLLERLGNPQDDYEVIHVGGTNGKGSVCRFLESILVKSGYSVGVYTSPHLQDISERITIDKNQISKDDLVVLVEKIKPVVEKMIEQEESPTFFEVFTGLVFLYFKQKKVEYVIVEVGLGGRFDATNIVKPLVSVITNVSLEHQDILGDKLEDIAFEKAGIIKENVPVVTAAKDVALDVVKKQAENKNVSVIVVDDSKWKKIKGDGFTNDFYIVGSLKDYKVRACLLGGFQGENIAVSVNVVEVLQMNGVYIPDDAVIDGIGETTFIGRMETVSRDPVVLLDGAHNIDGFRYLINCLKEDFEYKRLILVLGVLSDKKIDEMLSIILPITSVVVFTKSKSERACDPRVLKRLSEEKSFEKEVFVKENIENAVDFARGIAEKDDLVCVTGSLFTVGEARKIFVN